MKTLFIVSEKRVESHVGEEYDYILEVTDEPTTQTIQELANRVRTRIRSLWMEQATDDQNAASPKVVCHLDAASPFVTMLLDLQLILKEEEGIVVELPFFKDAGPQDPEAIEILRKLGNVG